MRARYRFILIAFAITAFIAVISFIFLYKTGYFTKVILPPSDKIETVSKPVFNSDNVKVENVHSKEINKPVFSAHYNSKQYKVRKEAATDLENFLMRAKLTQENRDVLNRKLIQVGIEVQEDSSVTVMPDDVWKAKLKTLRPDEIVRVKTGKKYYGEGTKELYDSVRIRVSDRSAPVISVTKTNAAQEEEEEEIVEELSQYEQRVKRRSNAVRNYLYSTFSKSINGQRHGKRRTVVNSYLDDTFQYYKKKAEER